MTSSGIDDRTWLRHPPPHTLGEARDMGRTLVVIACQHWVIKFPACQHRVVWTIDEAIARIRADRPLRDLRFRCEACGFGWAILETVTQADIDRKAQRPSAIP